MVEQTKSAPTRFSWFVFFGPSSWRANHSRRSEQNPKQTLPTLFSTLATRYATRPGGYTRLHLSGHRVGDHAPIAVLELVDNPTDLKFDTTARAVGRELAVKAREAGDNGKDVWKSFRASVESGSEEDVLVRLAGVSLLDDKTKKNAAKVLAYRLDSPIDPSSTLPPSLNSEEADESLDADESSFTPSLPPSTTFLNLAHTYYLRQLAVFTLSPSSSTTPVLHPERQVKQLTQRLTPREGKEPPRKVLTLPVLKGKGDRAGERRDGYAVGEPEEGSRMGGPIGRAKGEKGRQGRRLAESAREGVESARRTRETIASA